MNRSRLQTAVEVGPNHWVVARRGVWGGWDVIEVTPQISVTHSRHRHRAHAEVVAAAVAATRTHHSTERSA